MTPGNDRSPDSGAAADEFETIQAAAAALGAVAAGPCGCEPGESCMAHAVLPAREPSVSGAGASRSLDLLTRALAAEYERASQPIPVPADGVYRFRPGDQPLPVPNGGPSMHDLVIADLEGWPARTAEINAVRDLIRERKRIGLERYGSLLQAGNQRDWRRDLAEELGDASVYARQGLVELGGSGDADDLTEIYDLILTALFGLARIPEGGRG